jgi:hypothetical protein
VGLCNIFITETQIAAPPAEESSVSSDTTPGEPPSVQRSALNGPKPEKKATADGWLRSGLPER